jgi:hypothetical protein
MVRKAVSYIPSLVHMDAHCAMNFKPSQAYHAFNLPYVTVYIFPVIVWMGARVCVFKLFQ